MLLDIDQLKADYEQSKGNRELKKWVFGIATLGVGALYLWTTTKIIRDGEIGLRQTAGGKMVLLPPGRHSNFPWENYPKYPQALSNKIIELGPYKIITVDTGYVAKTFNKGKLEILGVGQHLISDAAHSFESLIPTKQETKKLHAITASTSDNVGLTLHADVRYQIENPEIAITQIDDIEDSIKEIAEISISQIVSHHSLQDFAPATTGVNPDKEHHGIGALLKELVGQVTEQLSKLGIKLINIGITSWSINDAGLAHELGQGAVVKSQTQSKLMAAENAAAVLKIETEAASNSIKIRAEADAQAVLVKGRAFKMIADEFGPDASAFALYQNSQQTDLVSHAKNANLFFSQSPGAGLPQPVIAVTPALI